VRNKCQSNIIFHTIALLINATLIRTSDTVPLQIQNAVASVVCSQPLKCVSFLVYLTMPDSTEAGSKSCCERSLRVKGKGSEGCEW
jgi:hypothetical protein